MRVYAKLDGSEAVFANDPYVEVRAGMETIVYCYFPAEIGTAEVTYDGHVSPS